MLQAIIRELELTAEWPCSSVVLQLAQKYLGGRRPLVSFFLTPFRADKGQIPAPSKALQILDEVKVFFLAFATIRINKYFLIPWVCKL